MRNLFVLTVLAFAVALPQAEAAAKFEVSGWIPYWRAATGTADVMPNLKHVTEINPFGYTVTTDGKLFDAAKMDQEPWVSLRKAAKEQGVRFIPTVMWSNREAIHRILSNQTTRVALAKEITALVNEKGYDGIDIDFENKSADTKQYFSTFLKGLYQRMGKKWVMCAIEARTPLDSRYDGTPPEGAGVYANDFKEINKYCDRVKLMTYDQGAIDVRLNKARAAPYVPVADPAWVEKVVLETAKTIPKKKLMIGIATYGYEYAVSPLTVSGYRYDQQWAFNPGYATALAKSLGITPVRNSSGELSFIYKLTPELEAVQNAAGKGIATESPVFTGIENGAATTLYDQKALASQVQPPFNIVWWSDAQAIQTKVDLAKKLGVKGVAVFKFDGGQDPKMWEVIKGI